MKIVLFVSVIATLSSGNVITDVPVGNWSGYFNILYVQYAPWPEQACIAFEEQGGTKQPGKSAMDQIRYRFADTGNSYEFSKGILASLLTAQTAGKKIRVYIKRKEVYSSNTIYYISGLEVMN